MEPPKALSEFTVLTWIWTLCCLSPCQWAWGGEESPEILQILAALSILGYSGELDSGLWVGGIVLIEVTSFLCHAQFL